MFDCCSVRLGSIVEVFDFRTLDCVRLAKFWGEFDEVQLPTPVEDNRTTGVRLGSITERSIDHAGHWELTLLFVNCKWKLNAG